MMSEVPNETPPDVLPDFRRSSRQVETDPKALQKAIVRARRQRADLLEVSELMGEEPETRRPAFSFRLTDTPESIGEKIRELLKFESIPRRTYSRPDDLLRHLVRGVEDLGVIVIQVQSVSSDVMRGFSLAEEQFPIIALNGADWPRGKIFTLLHEMVHVGLRHGGLCDLQHESDDKVERLCDASAGCALMPKDTILHLASNLQRPLTIDQLSAVGHEFGASGEAAMLRLVNLGHASWDEYDELREPFRSAYRKFKDDEKRYRDPDAPIYYQLKVRDLGRPFIRKILRAYGEDVVSSRDLAVMLNVKFDNVPRLASMVGGNG